MNDLQDLRKRIFGIVSDLNATHTYTETYTYSIKSGDDEGRNPDTWVEGEREVTEPDEPRRKQGRHNLDDLVRCTEPILLLQVPEEIVLEKVTEVYGINSLSNFIGAFDERDNRLSLDPTTARAYCMVYTRARPSSLLSRVIEGNIKPAEFQDRVINQIRTNLGDFVDKDILFPEYYKELAVALDSQYWKRDLNDLKLTLMYLERNPEFLVEVCDHATNEQNWQFSQGQAFDAHWHHMVGEIAKVHPNEAVTILVNTLSSDEYQPWIRVKAAEALRSVEEENRGATGSRSQLLELIKGPACRYAAKALSSYSYSSMKPDEHIAELFLAHWDKIDEKDWLNTLGCEWRVFKDKVVPSLVTTLLSQDTNPELKRRAIRLIAHLPDYNTSIVPRYDEKAYPLGSEQRDSLFSYLLDEAFTERSFLSEFFGKSSFGRKNIEYACAIASNKDEEKQRRVRAINVLGLYAGQHRYPDGSGIREVESYLRKVSFLGIGRFFEPDKDLRLAAREAYAKIK